MDVLKKAPCLYPLMNPLSRLRVVLHQAVPLGDLVEDEEVQLELHLLQLLRHDQMLLLKQESFASLHFYSWVLFYHARPFVFAFPLLLSVEMGLALWVHLEAV